MLFRVLDVSGGPEQQVLLIDRLNPFLREQACRKILGYALLDLKIVVHHEHVVRAPTICARRMGWRVRKVVIVERAFATGREKPREGVGEPQGTKYINGRLPAMCVGLRIEHGNAR